MRRGRRRSLVQWERIVDAQAGSGLSVMEFCRRESIGLTAFYRWRGRI